jgi:hypothetical protein
MKHQWLEVTLSSDIKIRSPVALHRADTTPIDSDVSVFTDADSQLTVVVDAGPFADSLSSVQVSVEAIAGRAARVAAYPTADGSGEVAAAHFPDLGLTVMVTGYAECGGAVPLQMVTSAEFI